MLKDTVNIIIESEEVKLNNIKNNQKSNYLIAQQQAYLNGMKDMWNFIQSRIDID